MSYFKNVQYVPYQFGSSNEKTLHQDLSVYVDLVDQIRDNEAFYEKYTILDWDRPDNLSQKLYKSTKYYWTFFLMNDKLRESGWPLTNQKVLELVKAERGNTVLTSKDDLTGLYIPGVSVTGQTSGVTGVVVQRRLDLGQLVIEGLKGFTSTENISDGTTSVTLTGAANQYDAVYKYEDSNGDMADIDPYVGAGALLSAVSYYDQYIRENNDLRDVIVIKPTAIDAVFEQWQSVMSKA